MRVVVFSGVKAGCFDSAVAGNPVFVVGGCWTLPGEVGIGFISSSMPPFLYRCPHTGLNVQGFVADDPTAGGGDNYVPVECLACSGIHLVNPATGKVLGQDDE